jgi:hypothetical protein
MNHDEQLQALREKMMEVDTAGRLATQLGQWRVISPYVLAQFLDVRPQMIYGYIKEGRIKSVRDNNTQKLYIEEEEALRFAYKYLENRARRRNKLVV